MILRLIPSLLLGLIVSGALYWMMYLMLEHHYDLTDREALTQVDFVRLHREDPIPETLTRELPPPPPSLPATVTPPPTETLAPAPASPSQPAVAPAFEMPRLALPVGGGTIAAPVTGATDWSSLAPPPPDAAGVPREAMPAAPGTSNAALAAIVRIPPTYPMEARRQKLQGWVRLEFTVTEDGSVTDIKVREARPPRVFDQAAINALGQWKFRPAMENGKPVRKRAAQTLKFELDKN